MGGNECRSENDNTKLTTRGILNRMAHHCYLSCIFLIAYRTLISDFEPRGDEPQPSSQDYGAYSSDGIGLASIWVGELQLDLDLDPLILTAAWRGLKPMELLTRHRLYLIGTEFGRYVVGAR